MGSAVEKTLSPLSCPDTYSHVLLSLATAPATNSSRTAVGSISTILLPGLAWKPSDLTELRPGRPISTQAPPPLPTGLPGGACEPNWLPRLPALAPGGGGGAGGSRAAPSPGPGPARSVIPSHCPEDPPPLGFVGV